MEDGVTEQWNRRPRRSTPVATSAGAVSPVAEIDAVAILGDREEQQDAYGVQVQPDGSCLVVLADGMGGHAAGRVASRLAVDAFIATAQQALGANPSLANAFDRAVESANAAIASDQVAHPERHGMGTTLVGAHISVEGIAWTSVGDSILFLWRDGELIRLNEDHSLRAVTKDAAKAANALVSALTGEEIAMIDQHAAPLSFAPNDLVIFASDGLLTLTADAIGKSLDQAEARSLIEIGDALIAAVVATGKPHQDNTTLVLARPFSGEFVQTARHSPPDSKEKTASILKRSARWRPTALGFVAFIAIILLATLAFALAR
jgi:serine/threonine protein phosphatase PrpC